ncbi:MAG: hypothetical protein A2571_01255 [Candidatus Vogelbacteria bacterium RIFOXYD1_FULL_44_32]|uniref:Transcriptional regulator n=1 Tax=Candidatus Vogelbacteria bacterium RIFOXYD1_FULL_44_32 TaxID=1802438 RepID=A0A1G2QEH1_9BACT|nr:MAG: hypothetical protein A2571_01255 [Candidatus Vogelbacteria bacterium RIFOXYD1_FULL_44_32]
MEILEKLFDSKHRVKLLRLFLFNPEVVFDRVEILKRSKVPALAIRRELALLVGVGLIKQKRATVVRNGRRKTVQGWELDPSFPLSQNLRSLLNTDFLRRKTDIIKRFRNCGRVKLLVVSGVFLNEDDQRLDILLVGDHLKKVIIEKNVRSIEAEVGRELNYAMLETEDFLYRVGTSDRFVRDIFDYPHERMIDKLTF